MRVELQGTSKQGTESIRRVDMPTEGHSHLSDKLNANSTCWLHSLIKKLWCKFRSVGQGEFPYLIMKIHC